MLLFLLLRRCSRLLCGLGSNPEVSRVLKSHGSSLGLKSVGITVVSDHSGYNLRLSPRLWVTSLLLGGASTAVSLESITVYPLAWAFARSRSRWFPPIHELRLPTTYESCCLLRFVWFRKTVRDDRVEGSTITREQFSGRSGGKVEAGYNQTAAGGLRTGRSLHCTCNYYCMDHLNHHGPDHQKIHGTERMTVAEHLQSSDCDGLALVERPSCFKDEAAAELDVSAYL